MRAVFTNIGPIADADIEIGDGITLVCAPNERGKSTLLSGIAGLVIGEPFLPESGHKKDAWTLVRSGAKSGSITLQTPEGSRGVTYPKLEMTSAEFPLSVERFALGLEPFLDLPKKERALLLSRVLKTEPTADEFGAYLKKLDLKQPQIEWASGKLSEHGWDAGYTYVSEQWTGSKGAWKEITGEVYGSDKAPAWTPEGWTVDIERATLEQLEQALAKTEAKSEQTRIDKALSAVDRANLEDQASKVETYREATASAKKALADLDAELQTAIDARAKAPGFDGMSTGACPFCGKEVGIHVEHTSSRVTLHKIDSKKGKEHALDMAGLDGTIERLKPKVNEARSTLARQEIWQKTAEDAAKKLDGLPKDVPEDDSAARDAAKLAVALKAKKIAADKKHASIQAIEKVRQALAPDGLRQTKLADTLKQFCEQDLRKLTESGGWGHVVIHPDMSVTSNGFLLKSESAAWRTNATIAVALAQKAKSFMVILDRADVNFGVYKNGLVTLLESARIRALVGMSIAKKEQVPDLEKMGIGRSYWINEKGIAERIAA